MPVSRMDTGLLRQEYWDTDVRSSYTFVGTYHGYDTTNKRLLLGNDSTNTSRNTTCRDTAWSSADVVINVTMRYVTTYRTTNSGQEIVGRWNSGGTYYYLKVDYNADTLTLYKYSGSAVYLIATAYIQLQANVYKIKLQMQGSQIKAKVWKTNLETEPASWLLETTDSTYTGSGNFQTSAILKRNSVDDFIIYTSPNITCTGLPDGYKIRVGGASGPVSPGASGGTTTADCSHVTFPVNAVEILNASNAVMATYTATGDIWGGDTWLWTSDTFPVLVEFDTLRQVVDDFSKNTNGLIKIDKFTTDTTSNYTLTGTVTWDSGGYAILGNDTAGVWGKLRDSSFAQSDFVLLTKIQHKGITSNANSKTNIAFRINGSNFYWVTLWDNLGGIELISYNGIAESSLGTAPFTYSRNTEYWVKISAIETQLKVKVWRADQSEPQSWQISVTDSLSASGAWQIFSTDLTGWVNEVHVVEIAVDTVRKVLAETTAQVDTRRKTVAQAVVQSDTYRKAQAIVEALADTLRTTTTIITALATVGTVRKITTQVSAQADTVRKFCLNLALVADVTRKVGVRDLILNDTLRKALKTALAQSHTYRKTRNLATAVTDSKRRLGVFNVIINDTLRKATATASAQADTFRKALFTTITSNNTGRKLAANITTVINARRKVQGIVSLVLDTLRNVLSRLLRRAPDYKTQEIADRYLATEIDDHYEVVEVVEKYEVMEAEVRWEVTEGAENYEVKEDDTEMKTFILGEEKELGVEITSTDGTAFAIEAAAYKYMDGNNELASGGCSVDAGKVYVLLKPTTAGFSQKVVFTITLQPLGVGEIADLSKNKETVKATVALTVNE